MSSIDENDHEYQTYTATAVHLRKIDSPARQTSTAGTESPESARDQRVTSAMPPPLAPYDHATPPTTPNFYGGTVPQSPFYSQTPDYTRSPEAAAVWQHGSQIEQTAPRGYGPRDGMDYNSVRDAQFNVLHPYSIPPFLQAYVANRMPKMYAQQQQLPHIVIPTAPNKMVDSIAPTPKELKTYDGTEHMPKKAKTKSASKAPDWLTGLSFSQRKQSPSKLFNKNFGFDIACLRAPSDRTPQISPRTSISQAESPCPLSPAESVKRQRIDSKSAGTTLGFPFGKPTPTKSMRGRDLGSPAMSPRASIVLATPPSSRHGTMNSEEVHPGTPVNWGTPSSPDEEIPSTRRDTYFAPLISEPRRRSFPSISLPAERKHSKEIAMLARLAALDSTTKHFGTSVSATTPAGRKRACTLERKERTNRKVGPQPTPSSAKSMKAMQERASRVVPTVPALKRATSDPSTEAFLKHVRASFEKRRRRKDAKENGRDVVVVDYSVFADEHERGFLDDAPL